MPPIFKLRTASGQIVPIRASSPEEAFDILDQIEAGKSEAALNAANSKYTVNPDERSPMSRFIGGVGEALNPLTMAQGIYQTVAHPIDTASALLDAQVDVGAKADEAERAGRGSEAAGYRLASGIPVLGPMIAGLGERAGSGDIAGAAGNLTGALAIPKVYGTVGKGMKAAAPSVANAAKTVAQGAGKAAMAVGPEVAGAAVGNAVGGLAGGAAGAALGNRVLRPMVTKFLREKMGMSPVRAQEAAARMPESELVKLAQESMPPQASIPQGPIQPSPVTGSMPSGQAMVPAPQVPPAPISSGMVPSTAIDPSRLGTVQGTVPSRPPSPVMSGTVPSAAPVRPIPPEKLPPVLPDPVVPELVPAGAQSKMPGAGDNARKWLQDYAAASPAGRQKLVKGLAGKLSYEDMRQLGAYTDDIATLNPGTAPAAVESHFRPVKLDGIERPVAASSDIVTAPPAFPGQQGAKGATKARFQMIEERLADAKMGAAEQGKAIADWVTEGLPDGTIVNRMMKRFKIKKDDALAIVRTAREALKESK